MNGDIQRRVAETIIHQGQKLLGDRKVYQRQGAIYLVTGEPGRYYLKIQKEGGERIIFTETLLLDDKEEWLTFFWSFTREGNEWVLTASSKNDGDLDEELLTRELIDFRERLENGEDVRMGGYLELPEKNTAFNAVFQPYLKKTYSYIYLLVASAVLVFGLFTTLFTGNLQYNRMARIVNRLDKTISASASLNENVLEDLNYRIQAVTADLASLEASLQREQQSLEFNRFNMSEMVKLSVGEIPSWQQQRRTAYFYLAGLMEQASSFGELYYHFTRLPRSETEASLLLATDIDNILELDSYNMAFSHFVYPTRNDGGDNDGKGFIISSGYTSQRVSPLGEGGYRPHYAVDIINVNNILKITPEDRSNILTREEDIPGAIVSVDDGRVVHNGEMGDYGWCIEIEHSPSSEIRAAFPTMTRITTFYAHMKEASNLPVGHVVQQDEKLGNIGNSGKSTGPHLHFEIRIYTPKGKQTGFEGGKYDGISPLTMK